jgi:acylphosphatase
MEKDIIIKVIGRVQGVFFRSHTREKALELGLTGWVRNEPDGSVTIMARGEEKALSALTEWCKGGPDASNVTGIEVTRDTPSRGKYKSFEIKY